MNSIFDSNIFIGAIHSKDTNNKRAVEILKDFENQNHQTVYITNYVVLEVLNFLLKKIPFPEALGTYNYLTETSRIKVLYVDQFMNQTIKELFKKYKSLSLTDCSLIVLSQMHDIKTIHSFD